MNLILKRSLTAIGCFPLLIVPLFMGGLVVGGAILGGIAGARDPEHAAAAGRQAGEQFGQTYGDMVFFLAILLAVIIALVVGFSGIFPWCRRNKAQGMPPPPPVCP